MNGIRGWCCFLVLALAVTGPAYGQIRSATVIGVVHDSSDAVVPDATVTITDQETAVSTTTKTTSTGQYTFPYMAAGTYTVGVNMQGFAPYRQTDVRLRTAETARVDVSLALAAVGTTVEVRAQTAQIQTESATVQSALQSEAISVLPNPTSNPMFYAFLQPGVVARSGGLNTTNTQSFGIGVSGRTQWSAMGVNGGRASTNEFQLDGLPVMGGGYNEGGGDAEHGRASGSSRDRQRLRRRIRARAGRHLDEHQVGDQSVPRGG